MATPSSILAWKIPRTEEPGGLQSTGSESHTQLKRLNMYIGIEESWPVDHHRSPCSLILEASAMLFLVCSACVHWGLSLVLREGPKHN